MPLIVAVPFVLSTKVTPLGNKPVSLNAAVGEPVDVTLKFPAVPTTNVVAAALVIAGAVEAGLIVSVKFWEAFGRVPLAAWIDSGYEPTVPVFGIPDSVAVPFPLSTKVTPLGRAPVSFNAAVGVPVVVTLKDPAVPTWNVTAAALVMAGAAVTFSVNDCVALGETPSEALIVIG